jgi:hypothetical protein
MSGSFRNDTEWWCVARYHHLVMHAITIRFPDDLAAEARAESEAVGESINQFVIEAVAAAIKMRHANRALQSMAERRARMTASGRVGSASEPLVRELREGIGRRD